jgi:hypothetical protein
VDAKVIAELKAALSKATPGPWMVDSTVALGAYGIWRDSKNLAEDEPMEQVCSMLPMEKRFAQEKRDADAALIVALVNNAEALIAAAERNEQLERLLDEAADALHINGLKGLAKDIRQAIASIPATTQPKEQP